MDVATPLEELLPRVGAAVARHRRRRVARHGLTPTAVAVLAALHGDGGDVASLRELAARLGLSPTTLTPVLDALEAGGLVRRERDRGDRRLVRLRRTAAGAARLSAVDRTPRLPRPDPAHEPAVRAYLLTVLAAAQDAGDDAGGGGP